VRIFEDNIVNIYGERGKIWLLDLPVITEKTASEYGLYNLKPITNLTHNYVLSGFHDHQPIILKLSLDIEGLKKEADTLNAFANFGAIRTIAQQDGVSLLEQAIPGISLKTYFPIKDDEAIIIACEVMKKLHQAPFVKQDFPHVKDWLAAIDKKQNIQENYLEKARKLRDQLLQNSSGSVLLHGDLHHDNILQNGTEWIVIDPKGVIGDPAYEVAAFIRNPLPELLHSENITNIINNRITKFSEILDLDSQRIKDWCFVQSALAWSWALEDNCDTKHFEKLIEIFDKL
jgi:streptomycin 6-kinase